MIRRWLIRSFFIAFVVICVGAWVGSTLYDDGLSWGSRGRLWRCEGGVGSSGGRCSLAVTWGEFGGGSRGWSFLHQCHKGPISHLNGVDYTFAGFRLQYSTVGYSMYEAEIPFWFLTLVCACLLWFVWRKTKPKPLGGAFPIEPSAKPK